MYVENNALLQIVLQIVHKTQRVMRINSSMEVVFIWTIAGSLSDTLSGGFLWLSLVIACYSWLSLVTS
jgi:hypothetical protein